jgi:hypothetical protein
MQSKHDYYKEKFNEFRFWSDDKPQAVSKHAIGKQARAWVRHQLRRELEDFRFDHDHKEEMGRMAEIDLAYYCYAYGPCEKCRRDEFQESQ